MKGSGRGSKKEEKMRRLMCCEERLKMKSEKERARKKERESGRGEKKGKG